VAEKRIMQCSKCLAGKERFGAGRTDNLVVQQQLDFIGNFGTTTYSGQLGRDCRRARSVAVGCQRNSLGLHNRPVVAWASEIGELSPIEFCGPFLVLARHSVQGPRYLVGARQRRLAQAQASEFNQFGVCSWHFATLTVWGDMDTPAPQPTHAT
jgi:hypothetical protein